MSSIAPIWDANQTWIVFGGGALLIAFPVVYGVLFSALYIPLLTFLFGLIFRGIAFEFRTSTVMKRLWDRAFFGGSLVAVMAQGLTLGGIISGVRVNQGSFAGGPFGWLTPFSVTVGIALMSGYLLLGSTYLILKTPGPLQDRAFKQALRFGPVVLGFQILVSFWTPIHHSFVLQNWFHSPRIYFIWAFPVVGLMAFYRLIKSLRLRREIEPFCCTILLFLAGYLGLAASFYPYAVPASITFREAVAQQETLRFTLLGVIVVLPLVVGYTMYSYSVFRGKIGTEDEAIGYG